MSQLTPEEVTKSFFRCLEDSDLEAAMSLLSAEVEYTNVGLPSVHGRRNVARLFRRLTEPRVGFEVYFHSIASNGPTVLTERTDVVEVGRLRLQFWVCGRIDVVDGQITLWRDYFDFLDVAKAFSRGTLGALVSGLRPTAPKLGSTAGR